MKPYKYLVHYYDNEKELREPILAYGGEALESHTRFCREECEGNNISIELTQQEAFECGVKPRELRAEKDIEGTLDDLFSIYPDAEYNYVEGILLIN